MRWERVVLPRAQEAEQGSEEAGGSGKRWAHTCNAIKGGRFLYVFGGFGIDYCQTNEVHVFDTVEQTWSQPTIKGMPPAPRDGHSCTNVGDNLFVFGGTDGMNPLGDLHILYTSSHTWISPMTRGEGPEARQGHSAALVDKRLFIFGGYGKSPDNGDEVYYNDLFILNTETFVWNKPMMTGIPPSPRHTHGCSTWKNKMIVLGGEDGCDNYLSDVHILNAVSCFFLSTIILFLLSFGLSTGHTLPPRAGYLTITFGKFLLVYGGYTEAQKPYDDLYLLDVESAIWSTVTTAGAGPSARFSMAGDCLDPVRSGVLIFVGGCNGNLEALDDMYYLHTGAHGYLSKQSQPIQGKFQARVKETFGDQYTIETAIDGKPLRGIIFSSKPSTLPIPFSSSSRIRTCGDSSAVMPNGYYNGESEASGSIQPDSADDGQVDDVDGIEASEPHAEPAGPLPVSNVTQPFDGCDLDKVNQPCSSNVLLNFYHKYNF
ncbi:hypothetical protein EUGRSUZ_B00620 [Eucalyptus grandis]|uniref:Uncharacterized protein n=2 Tax=Eucalyptus grandis TaxID=71139 RepID=A0ACC3LNB5_EUCGR|nr:hypothetical protein EUGRSUZ_B00620 [Eucalyptus grandis]